MGWRRQQALLVVAVVVVLPDENYARSEERDAGRRERTESSREV